MLFDDSSVAVIILNYNGNKDTVECIKSVLDADYHSLKIFLVDNCSEGNCQDELSMMYKGNDKVEFIPLDKNIGFSGGNNVGIRRAIDQGFKYILLLNNDTVVEKGYIKPLVNIAIQNNDNVLVTGKIKFYSDKKKIWFAGGNYNKLGGNTVHYGYNCEDCELYNVTKEVNFSTGCLMLIPSKVFNKIGGLPEHYFLYYEDNEYSLRAIENGFSIIYVPDSVIYHKVSKSTKKLKGMSQYYMIRNSLQLCKEHNNNLFKIFTYIIITMRSAKRISKHAYDYKVVKKAYHDFFFGLLGEQDV